MTFRFYNNPVATPDYENPDVLKAMTAQQGTPDVPVTTPGQTQTPAPVNPVASTIPAPVNPVASTIPAPAAPSTPVVPTVKPVDAEAYLGGLLATPAPAPTYDKTSEEYLNKLAKSNQIGNFLTLLSDVAGTAMGAPVQQRQFRSSAPYLQQILENRAKYNAAKQNYQTQEYYRKLQNATTLANQQWQKEKFAEQQKQASDQFKAKMGLEGEKLGISKQRLDMDEAYNEWRMAKGVVDSAFQRKKFATQTAQKNRELELRGESSKTGPVKVQTATKTYELPREEFNRYTEEAFSDPEVRTAHPEWFSKTGEQQVYNPQTNTIELKGGREMLNPTVKPEFLVKYWLEKKEKQAKAPAATSTTGSKPSMFQPKSKLIY